MDKAALITFATAMFTILNPIGNVAIFAGMVASRSAADRRSIAIKCAIAVAAILVATVWVGEMVLSFFGVEIPSSGRPDDRLHCVIDAAQQAERHP